MLFLPLEVDQSLFFNLLTLRFFLTKGTINGNFGLWEECANIRIGEKHTKTVCQTIDPRIIGPTWQVARVFSVLAIISSFVAAMCLLASATDKVSLTVSCIALVVTTLFGFLEIVFVITRVEDWKKKVPEPDTIYSGPLIMYSWSFFAAILSSFLMGSICIATFISRRNLIQDSQPQHVRFS